MVFKTVGKAKTWDLPSALVAEWSRIFPGVDVMAQCVKARGWAEANPTKRKTARGMAGFLFRWMDEEQNRIRPGRQGQGVSRDANSVKAAGEWYATQEGVL